MRRQPIIWLCNGCGGERKQRFCRCGTSSKARKSLRTVAQRNELAEQHLALPRWMLIAGRYHPRRLTDDEAESAGFLGLLRAAELWDETKGAFSTYAVWWMRFYMQEDDYRATLIHVPDYLKDKCRDRKNTASYRQHATRARQMCRLAQSVADCLPGRIGEPIYAAMLREALTV